jgi:ribosomal protein S18 acetylase RimI-like enzyme
LANCSNNECVNKNIPKILVYKVSTTEERLNVLAFRHGRLVPTITQYMQKQDISNRERAIEELSETWLESKNVVTLQQFYAVRNLLYYNEQEQHQALSAEQNIIGSVDAEWTRASPKNADVNDSIEVELKNLRVHQSARRQGIGRALVHEVQQYAEQLPQPSIVFLEVVSDNSGAILLYEQMGFVVDSMNPNRMTWSAVPYHNAAQDNH